jgi:hypothetical protein
VNGPEREQRELDPRMRVADFLLEQFEELELLEQLIPTEAPE